LPVLAAFSGLSFSAFADGLARPEGAAWGSVAAVAADASVVVRFRPFPPRFPRRRRRRAA
jgi:hypothetical protein